MYLKKNEGGGEREGEGGRKREREREKDGNVAGMRVYLCECLSNICALHFRY